MSQTATRSLRFFSRPDCPLCDEAELLLQDLGAALTYVDIEDSIELLDRYGARVPVLQRSSDGAELDWPFDAKRARSFIDAG